MSIYRDELILALRSVVETDRHKWKEAAFTRAVNSALVALGSSRPNYYDASLALVAGTSRYAAPADLLDFTGYDWGNKQAHANNSGVTNHLVRPRVYSSSNADGKSIKFSFAPTAEYIAAWGSTFCYTYRRPHTIPADISDTDTPCTIRLEDYDLLLTRSLASLMAELLSANVTDPVQMHRGMGATIDYSGTPAKAYLSLMAHYRELVTLS